MRGVYGIRCLRNNRLYVGSSIHMRQRWNSHRGQLRHGKHANHDLQADWTAYGEAAFVFEILERVPSGDLDLREEMHIEKNGTKLYNHVRLIATGRVARGVDYQAISPDDALLDHELFWTWAADEINAEWGRDGKLLMGRRSDYDPGVLAQHDRAWRVAVAERADRLRLSRES